MTLPIVTPPIDTKTILQKYFEYGTQGWWSGRNYTNATPNITGWSGTAYSIPQEHAIRGAAMNAFALAVAIPTNIWTARLVLAVSQQHISNPSQGRLQWGKNWQSPLWAAWTGLAAMVGWNGLPYESNRNNVKRMLISEADYVVASRPPLFWRKNDHSENYPGDSKAEENSWCATVCWVAAAFMPTHPNAAKWLARARDLALSAFAPPGEDARGYNVTGDYLVINHNRIHPDYMTTVTTNFFAEIAYALVDRSDSAPNGVFNAAGEIWHALQNVYLDGNNTIAYNNDSPRINFPTGTPNDWGTRRPASYAVLDGLVDLFDLGDNAGFYASIHMADVADMQNRHADGHFVANAQEGNYPEENSYTASQVAFLHLARQIL